MALETTTISTFNELCSRIFELTFVRKGIDRNSIIDLVDEINCLDFSYPFVNNENKAVLLVNQLCSISHDDSELVQKSCELITTLINNQFLIIENPTFKKVIDWCIKALEVEMGNVTVQILTTLDALLGHNSKQSLMLLPTIIDRALVINLAHNKNSPDVALAALRCLETCTFISCRLKENVNSENISQLECCAKTFLKYLTEAQASDLQDVLFLKILVICIRGLQNIICKHSRYLHKELGLLLGISKAYMIFDMNLFITPQKIVPSMLNIPDQSTNVSRKKKGGKIAKERKQKASSQIIKANTSDIDDVMISRNTSGYTPAVLTLDADSFTTLNQSGDSDASDTESSKMGDATGLQRKVQRAALNLLFQIIKSADKHLIFCYWSTLIPDGSILNNNNLITWIFKGPTIKFRLIALNALLCLLTRSKLYLSQAESSEKYTSYTPFSIMLGSSIEELHKNLILALNESSVPILIMVLKCLASLVQATPYHKLIPGIISKVVRSVKPYIKHKDVTVRIASLVVLGCVLVTDSVLPETKETLLKPRKFKRIQLENKNSEQCIDLIDIECLNHLSLEEENETATTLQSNHNMSWLLEECLRNLGLSLNLNEIIENVPASVKIESLQLLSAMTRNYFVNLMIPHLGLIAKVLNLSLSESYTDLTLHAGRTIDFIGQTINLCLKSSDVRIFSVEQAISFWEVLINNDTFISLLSPVEHSVLRAVGCDCLGSIGPDVFELLPKQKQLLIITSLFTRVHDEKNSVRAAAIRSLGILVLYPSLREDGGFVQDVAEAINFTLLDDCMIVRIKASWSVGNLSDTLVLNQLEPDIEKFPTSLLLKILKITIKITKDNDKVKVNAVRALGNLLQLVTNENIDYIKDEVEEAIDVLVRDSTVGTNMKVRWNSCYAIGNILKNSFLYLNNSSRQDKLFNSLVELVMSFRNFKVRINAALALASPAKRECYGLHFTTVWSSLLQALENTQNIEDFTEYNHRDHLVEQICLTFGHMTTLLTIEDLIHVHNNVVLYLEILKLQMHRVLDRMVPEKTSVLLYASNHIKDLLFNENLTAVNRETLHMLCDIFINNTIYN